jgi:hypothetical protein
MSFIGATTNGKVYTPGYFLAHGKCVRETREAKQSDAITENNGTKYVKMGMPYPSNDASCIGFVYEDTDVTTGNMPVSVVTSGVVYEDRLPVELSTEAKTALEATKSFEFIHEPTVTRPY